jgi:hypothetical protein
MSTLLIDQLDDQHCPTLYQVLSTLVCPGVV